MANIGEGLWFDLDLNDNKFQSKIAQIERQVEGLSKTIKLDVDKSKIDDALKKAFEKKQSVSLDINASSVSASFAAILDKQIKAGAKIGVDKTYLLNSINTALKDAIFEVKVRASGKGDNSVTVDGVKEVTKELKNQEDVTSSLAKKFMQLYSIDMAKRFLTQVVEIGGELEKQKLALSSIVGDSALADKLYGQMANLSMVSPFDVQDIMKYSKQLSAFGIQYNDLYETTKRLSDIAAGVGVDFGRIAYEFGQTSSRGHLDARELRMFANSGIPLLKKLSEYYSKIQGTTITSGQVRGMITNREVSFEDVRNVLWEMTDAGGMFYNMQEVMAESLASKWRNLANAFNLMLNSMAEGWTGGTLKWVAEVLTSITKAYKDLTPAIITSIPTIFLWKNAVSSVGSATFASLTWTQKFKQGIAGAGKSLASFGASLAKMTVLNPFFWITAVVGATVTWISHLNNARSLIEGITDKTKEMATEGIRNMNETLATHTKDNIGSMSSSQIQEAMKELKEEVKKYDPLWKKTFSKIFETKEAEGQLEYVKSLNEQYVELIDRLEQVRDGYREVNEMPDIGMQMDKNSGGYWWDDSYGENAKKAAKAYAEAQTIINKIISTDSEKAERDLKDIIRTLESRNDLSGDSVWAKTLEDIEKATKTSEKYVAILNYIGNQDFDHKYSGFTGNLGFGEALSNFNKYRQRMISDTESMYNTLANLMVKDNLEIDESIRNSAEKTLEYLRQLPEEKRIQLIAEFDKILDQHEITDETLREMFRADLLVKKLRYDISYNVVNDNLNNPNAYQKVVLSSLPKYSEWEETMDASGNVIKRTHVQLSSQEQAIKNIETIVKKSKDAVELADALQKKYDGVLKDEKQYLDDLSAKKERPLTEDEIRQAKEEFKRIKEINKYERQYAESAAKAGGINLQVKGQGNGGRSNRDNELEELKKDYQQYKTIWQDYKTLSEKYGTEVSWDQIMGTEAWKRVESLNGIDNQKDFLKVTEKFQGMVDELLKSPTTTNNNRESRKQFWQTIFKDLLGMENDVFKPEIEKAVAEMNNLIADEKEKFDLFDALFKVSGDEDASRLMAKTGSAVDLVDSFTQKVREQLKDKDIDLNELFEMDENTLKMYLTDTKMAKPVMTLLKALKDAISKEKQNFKNVLTDAISNAMTAEDRYNQVKAQVQKNIKDAIASGIEGAVEAVEKDGKEKLGKAAAEMLMEVEGPIRDLMNATAVSVGSRSMKSIKELRDMLDYIETGGKKGRVPKNYTKKQLEDLKNNAEELTKLYKELQDASSKMWEGFKAGGEVGNFIAGIGEGFEKIALVRKYRKERDKANDKDKKYWSDLMALSSDEAWSAFGNGFASASDYLSGMCGKMKELADATGDIKLADEMERAQEVLSIVSATAQGAASGGWIGALVGLSTSTLSAVLNDEVNMKIYSHHMKEMKREFFRTQEIMNGTVNDEDWDTIFGTDAIGRATDAYGKYQDMFAKFTTAIGADASNAIKTLNNLQIKTKKGSLFHHGEFHSLEDYSKRYNLNLWDENGVFNVENAKAFLETHDAIDESVRNEIQHVIDLEEAYKEAKDAVDGLLEEWYGDWASSLTDAIFDSILSGKDAWSEFEKAGAEAILNIGKTMIQSKIIESAMKPYEGMLEDAFAIGDKDAQAKELVRVTGLINDTLINTALPAAINSAESLIESAKKAGVNMDSVGGSSSGLSSSIKGVTEETASLLGAYMNSMRADLSVQRSVIESIGYEQLPKMSVIAESQLAQLNLIAENTRMTAEFAEICADYAEETRDLFVGITNGTKKVSIE